MFHLAVVLENGTSLVVVSMRSTTPALSYILIEDLPKRCFTQVPSIHVENREPISCANRGVSVGSGSWQPVRLSR